MKKLVRNHIPYILKHVGTKHSHRKLEGDELHQAFRDKLHEEWQEFWETPNEEEMADCLQVLQDTAKLFDIDWEKVKVARTAKAVEKGDFTEGVEVTFS